jgi:hypothetical protein
MIKNILSAQAACGILIGRNPAIGQGAGSTLIIDDAGN